MSQTTTKPKPQIKGQRQTKKPTYAQLEKEYKAYANSHFYRIGKEDRLTFDDGSSMSCNWQEAAIYICHFQALIVYDGGVTVYEIGTNNYYALKFFVASECGKPLLENEQSNEIWCDIAKHIIFCATGIAGLILVREEIDRLVVSHGLGEVAKSLVDYCQKLAEAGANAAPPTGEEEVKAKQDLASMLVVEDALKATAESQNNNTNK